MSDDRSTPWMPQCPMCGSQLPLNTLRCWLCGEDQPGLTRSENQPELTRTEHQPELTRSGPRPFDPRSERTLKLASSLVILLTVGLVWLSVTIEEPGLGIALLIILVAPIVRTTYVMNERVRQQKANSKIELLFMFSMSLAVTLTLLGLVGMVAVGTFCTTCFILVGDDYKSKHVDEAVIFSGIVTLGTLWGLTWLLWRFLVSSRFRRDVEKP